MPVAVKHNKHWIDGGEGRVLYDSDLLTASVEEIALEDELMQAMWGARLSRVVLSLRDPDASGSWTLRVTR